MRGAALALALLLVPAVARPNGPEAESWRNTIYFYTYVTHFEPTPETNETLKWIGYSRTLQHEKWRFVTGASTYVDSYSVRSYAVFSDISHDDFRLSWVRPALSAQCHYKGKDYGSTERQFYCFPVPKLKFGGDEGFMANVAAVPKIGKITNGWASVEFGYQW